MCPGPSISPSIERAPCVWGLKPLLGVSLGCWGLDPLKTAADKPKPGWHTHQEGFLKDMHPGLGCLLVP